MLMCLRRSVEKAMPGPSKRRKHEVPILAPAAGPADVRLTEADNPAARVVARGDRLGEIKFGGVRARFANPKGTLGPGTVLPPPAVPIIGSTSPSLLTASALSDSPAQATPVEAATAARPHSAKHRTGRESTPLHIFFESLASPMPGKVALRRGLPASGWPHSDSDRPGVSGPRSLRLSTASRARFSPWPQSRKGGGSRTPLHRHARRLRRELPPPSFTHKRS
jgi:hypothetical protein